MTTAITILEIDSGWANIPNTLYIDGPNIDDNVRDNAKKTQYILPNDCRLVQHDSGTVIAKDDERVLLVPTLRKYNKKLRVCLERMNGDNYEYVAKNKPKVYVPVAVLKMND